MLIIISNYSKMVDNINTLVKHINNETWKFEKKDPACDKSGLYLTL